MAKNIIIPTRFQRVKIVNRCIMCGRIIPLGSSICSICDRKRKEALKKFLRGRR